MHSPDQPYRRLGIIGLGHMGHALAGTLLDCGHDVTVYDRDAERAESLRQAGAHVAADLAALAAACDVVISSLPDDAAVSAVALADNGLVHALREGALHISTSTVSPGLSRKLAQAHADHGQHFVAATIVGNPDLARLRQIFILAAGHADALALARPLLEQLGQRLFVMGDDAGLANVMKLACNVLTASTLQSMGEVLALLGKAGIDAQQAFQVLTGTLFDGRVHKAYGSKIVDRRYSPPGMTVPLAVKDLRLALAEAEAQQVPMPVTSLVHDRLVATVAAGWGALDWSALGALAVRDAGLDAHPTRPQAG